MLNVLWRVVFWGVVYLLVTLLPRGVAMLGSVPAGRGFLIEFGVGLGSEWFDLV